MAQITPTTVVVEIQDTSKNRQETLALQCLLHIDVDVEEPGTSENPMRSFEIHNIGSHSFWP